jgi:hypothetical protein
MRSFVSRCEGEFGPLRQAISAPDLSLLSRARAFDLAEGGAPASGVNDMQSNPESEGAALAERGSPDPQQVGQSGTVQKVPSLSASARCCGSGEPRSAAVPDSAFGFNLFSVAAGGSPLTGARVAEDLAVTNGLFLVTLDFGAAPFDGSDRWLEIGVRPGASAGAFANVAPRQPITRAPYALWASKAAEATSAQTAAAVAVGAGPTGRGQTERRPLHPQRRPLEHRSRHPNAVRADLVCRPHDRAGAGLLPASGAGMRHFPAHRPSNVFRSSPNFLASCHLRTHSNEIAQLE